MSRYRRTAKILIAAILAGAIAGCRNHGANPYEMASVRVIDCMPAGEDLTLSVDGVRGTKTVRFGDNTGYAVVKPGTYRLRISASFARLPIMIRSFTAVRRQAYTVAILPKDRYGGLVVAEPVREGRVPAPLKGKAIIRFVSLAHADAPIAVALNSIVAVDRLHFGEVSSPLPLAPGSYVMTGWAGRAQALTSTPVVLSAGGVYSAFLMSSPDVDPHARTALVMRLYDDNQ